MNCLLDNKCRLHLVQTKSDMICMYVLGEAIPSIMGYSYYYYHTDILDNADSNFIGICLVRIVKYIFVNHIIKKISSARLLCTDNSLKFSIILYAYPVNTLTFINLNTDFFGEP